MSSTKYEVRYAEKEDLGRVAHLVIKGIKDIGVENIRQDYVINAVIVNYSIAPCLCLWGDDELVGVVPLKISSNYWSDEKYLTSLMYFVLPKHRSLPNLKLLTKSITDFASLHGLPYRDNFMGADKNDARRRLMRRNGFKEIGIILEGTT